MRDKSIRTSPDAAESVKRYASEEGLTQAQASSRLIEAGARATKAPSDDSDKLGSIQALAYTDKNGNAYSVTQYAAEHGLDPYDAVCRLVRVALGREGALARHRAKRPPKAPRGPKTSPWELPGEGSTGT